MSRRLSNAVLRLIAERSYAAGDLAKVEQEAALREAEVRAARKTLKAARAKVAKIDAEILALEPGLTPEAIAARRRTLRTHDAPHGAIVAALVAALKDAGPEGTTTDALRDMLLDKFPMDQSTWKLRRQALTTVSQPLRVLAAKGAVARLPDEVAKSGRKVGRWAWIADD